MEEKKNFIISVLYYALIIGLAYLFCNYLLGIFMPFILGFIFAYIAVRLTKVIFKKESKKLRVLALIILYLIIIAILALLVSLGINEIIEFIGSIPNLYKQYVEPIFTNSNNGMANSNLPIALQEEIASLIVTLFTSIKTLISNISSYLVTAGTSIISNTTNVLVGIITTVIVSFFFVYDYDGILIYLESLMSENTKNVYHEIKDFLVNTVFLVVKSYITIMFITFIELLIGLAIIGIDNFALIAMATSVLDIFPVLGVGTVLIPWGLFQLAFGKVSTGIMLLILYIVISVIRHIIEPKIVGGNLDLHPLATLFAMLIGLELFGIVGMFCLPLLMSFFVKRGEKNKAKAAK